MPNRVRRNSVVDLLAKVPVNKGSLLKGIENLLKTIESSESAVMIPTLLRDKCEFDAWELLFVAKILKASILGHSDLVEFYMNHIGHNNLHAQANGLNQQQSQAASLSPSLATTPTLPARQAHSSSPSPNLNGNANANNGSADQQHQANSIGADSAQQDGCVHLPVAQSLPVIASTPQQLLPPSPSEGEQSGAKTSPTSAATSSSGLNEAPPSPQHQESLLAAARPLLMRQAQPPSLLQLTTTNNHINSVSVFTNNNIEQLTNQLSALQANGYLSQGGGGGSIAGSDKALSPDGALSISTGAANQLQANGSAASSGGQQPAMGHELRTSRSAGCLYRMNSSSGASSPRTPIQTPTTPHCPQAETLAQGLANGLPGDPSAPVKLLLQIEQLKSSISHVTSLLESVVELYKKSIDNIAMA